MSKSIVILGLIIFLVAALRLVGLSANPPSLNWDEISHGYNAYSLLLSGRDQWGSSWPVFNFRAYGDYPTTLYMYLSMPFIFLFGLNAFSIRLVSALCGIGITLLIPLFIQKITGKKSSFWLALILSATSPFLIFTSRAVYQSTPALFFYLWALYYFLDPKTFGGGLIPLALSLFAYHNARLIALPTFLIFFFFYRRKIVFKTHLLPISIFILLSLLSYYQLAFGPAAARSRWVGIITPAAVNTINNLRNNSHLPSILPRLIYNKPAFFGFTVAKNIFDFFNPLPLFITGSAHYQFNLPNFGLFYPVLLPFFYLGIFLFLKAWRSHISLLLIFALTLLPAAITLGDFPSLRLSLAYPFYFLFIVLGINQFFLFAPRLFRSAFWLVLFVSFLSFLYQYFIVFPYRYALAWQDGYSQLVTSLKPLYSSANQIYITKKYGEPHEFVLFYWPVNPTTFRSSPSLNWDFHADWYWVNSFDKFVFFNDWEVPPTAPNSILVTSTPQSAESGLKLVKVVTAANNLPVFYVYHHDSP
jgi:4-amino-4-deoxy-L-arabinose transferase-like glycosyltransferase